jgi:hypothetical protein
VPKKPDKSEEYHRLAGEAAALAMASDLEHVREKHRTAAAQWAALAASEEGRRRPGAANAIATASTPENELCAA